MPTPRRREGQDARQRPGPSASHTLTSNRTTPGPDDQPASLREHLVYCLAQGASAAERTGRPWMGLWATWRALRQHPEAAALNSGEICYTVDALLREIYPDAPQPWRAALPWCDDRDPLLDLLGAWDRVADLLEHAVAQARARPLRNRQLDSTHLLVRLVVSVAGYLATYLDGPIAIPCEAWARHLGVSARAIGQARALAVAWGYLEVVEEYRPPTGGRPGKARMYRVATKRFEELRES